MLAQQGSPNPQSQSQSVRHTPTPAPAVIATDTAGDRGINYGRRSSTPQGSSGLSLSQVIPGRPGDPYRRACLKDNGVASLTSGLQQLVLGASAGRTSPEHSPAPGTGWRRWKAGYQMTLWFSLGPLVADRTNNALGTKHPEQHDQAVRAATSHRNRL
ncbi:unnamed protein product [Boreogadus saida]